MTTATRQLIEVTVPDLEALVLARREDGASWHMIRDEVVSRSGVRVSHQTLINWFGAA